MVFTLFPGFLRSTLWLREAFIHFVNYNNSSLLSLLHCKNCVNMHNYLSIGLKVICVVSSLRVTENSLQWAFFVFLWKYVQSSLECIPRGEMFESYVRLVLLIKTAKLLHAYHSYKRPIAPQFFQHLELSVVSMLICMKLYYTVVSFSHFLVATEKEDVHV